MDSYADWLRSRDDDELRALLSARPELITPVPADMIALAARAATSAAVSRALDRLDVFELAVLEALLILDQPAEAKALHAALRPARSAGPQDHPDITDEEIGGALRRLRATGLVWGEDATLRTAPGVRQGFGHPAGLGPPIREAFAGYPAERLVQLITDLKGARPRGFSDTARLIELLQTELADPARLIADAGPEAERALAQLAWGPPVGRVADARRPVRATTASTPVERLLARGLLAATDDHTVTLPREIALHLREGLLFRDLTAVPPPLTGTAVPQGEDLVSRTAAGQAFTAVRMVEDLLERWGLRPPAVLRGGGLGVRDLRAAAAALDVAEWQAALLIEVAYAAGLLARADGMDGAWLPTYDFDLWRMRDTAERWADLASAWLETDRVPGLAGERDARDRAINALADESVRGSAPATRRATLESLAAAHAGIAPTADSVRARLAWSRPRRSSGPAPGDRAGTFRDRLVGWTLREAEALGLTGFGAPAGHALALLVSTRDPASVTWSASHQGTAHRIGGRSRTPTDPVRALARFLPEPVDKVLIQADLTAVAPGPLVAELAGELALVADVESTGGATVYRFTPGSVRRALDAGRSAAELNDLLSRHSATPVPQPLTYMIEDVARRHGHLRVGLASSYVRTDDPAVLDEILADRRASSLRLQRLAPTVLASRLSRGELLEALRSLGLAPVAESPEGGVVINRPDTHRVQLPPDDGLGRTRHRPHDAESMITAAVRALRAGDEAARHGTEVAKLRRKAPAGEPPRSPAMALVEELRRAQEKGARVWIGYLDQQGQASSRIVEPVRVEGGFLTGYDATRAAVLRFALHRITGVSDVDDSAGSAAPQ